MARDIEKLRSAVQAEMAALEPQDSPEAGEAAEPEVGEEQAVEEQAPGQTVDDDGGIEYINDLPDALGWSPEDLYELKLKLADDQDPVKFGEIKDRLQGLEEERRQLQQQREEFERRAAEQQQRMMAAATVQQTMTAEMAEADRELKALEGAQKALEADWAAREATDPGRVALERQHIATGIETAKGKLAQAGAKAQQQRQQSRQQWLAQQHAEVAKRIPDWNIPEKRKALIKDLVEFAAESYGVSAQEMNDIDARTLMMLNDAMDGRRVKAEAKGAVEKIRKAPRVPPRGLRYKGKAVSESRVAELKNRAVSTGKSQDRLAAARAIMGKG